MKKIKNSQIFFGNIRILKFDQIGYLSDFRLIFILLRSKKIKNYRNLKQKLGKYNILIISITIKTIVAMCLLVFEC